MKKILTSALAILLFVGASQAQTTNPENGHQRGHGKEMMKDMNLTDAQKTQLKTIHEAEKKDMDALKAKGDVTPEGRKALREKYRSQVDAVFTPEQREQMKAKMPDRKTDSGDKGGRGFGKKDSGFGKRAPFMNKELNLTADQQTKLKAYAEDFHAKAKDIRANNGLTDAQKKEQMRNLSKTYREQSKAILSADQLKKMQEMHPKHKGRGAATTWSFSNAITLTLPVRRGFLFLPFILLQNS